MIHPDFVKLAITKIADPGIRSELEMVLGETKELFALEQDFPRAMAESKATRVEATRREAPEKLSRSQKDFLSGADQDLANLIAEQLNLYQQLSAKEILQSLVGTVLNVPRDWGHLIEKTHPTDRPIVERIVALQRRINGQIEQLVERL